MSTNLQFVVLPQLEQPGSGDKEGKFLPMGVSFLPSTGGSNTV